MSAHDHPTLSDITNLAVAVAFLQRVLEAPGGLVLPLRPIAHARNLVLIRVGEGLRPGWLGCGLGGKVKFGRDGRHAGAATTTSTLTSVGFLIIWKMLGGICPLSLGDPWRAAPSALGRHMPAAQLQARGITEILTAAAKNALHTSGRPGLRAPSLCTASRRF